MPWLPQAWGEEPVSGRGCSTVHRVACHRAELCPPAGSHYLCPWLSADSMSTFESVILSLLEWI